LAPIAITLGVALLWAQPAAARTVSRLPRSDYTVRAACAAPAPGHAGCLALQLVPQTAEARAHTHPIGVASAALATTPSPAAGEFGVRPQDLHSAYELPTGSPSAQTIALVDAYNDPSAEADLATYSKEFGLPECTAASGCFKQVNQNGEATNLPFPKTRAILTKDEQRCIEDGSEEACFLTEEAEGWAVEISLDIETAHAVCQNCHIALVEANSSTYANLETAEDEAVTLGASEVSNSWAGPECSGGCIGDSTAFNHPGVVIAAAAGDNG
jgi:subtilase family serine protease